LVTGENIVAVEVHQANVTSSDLSFALQIIGATGDTPPQPVVSIIATQPATREADAVLKTAPGKFVVSRTGSLDTTFPIFIRYDGSATTGADYAALPIEIDLAPGEASRELSVEAVSDHIKEPTESVVARISEPPTRPDVIPYNIDSSHASATVTIADSPTGIEITAPANGATFNAGDTIVIAATAVATQGTIQVVKFYDGDVLIGTSAPIFITAPTPGAPINHRFEWQNAPIGDHVLTARGAVDDELGTTTSEVYISQKVMVHVREVPQIPVLSIEATQPTTSEPLPNALVAPGVFTIRRSAPTDTALTAWVAIGGTAQNGVDYESVANQVQFAAGQVEAGIKIAAKSDDLVQLCKTARHSTNWLRTRM
jgi:hypothetical protein